MPKDPVEDLGCMEDNPQNTHTKETRYTKILALLWQTKMLHGCVITDSANGLFGVENNGLSLSARMERLENWSQQIIKGQ